MKRRTSGFVVGSVFLSVLLGSYLAYGQQMDLLNPDEQGGYEILPLKVLNDGTVVGLAEEHPRGYYQRVFFWHPDRGMQILPRLIDVFPPNTFSGWPPQIIGIIHTFQLGQSQKVMFLCREHPEAWRPLNPPYFYIDADSNGEYRFYSLCYNHNFTYFTMAPYNGYTFVSKGEPWLGEYFMPDSLCTSFIEQYFTLLDISQAIVGLSGCISSGYDNFWLYRFASTHAFSFPGRGDKILWGVGYRLDGYECPPIDQWIPARLRWQGNQGSLQLIPGGGAGAVVSISDDLRAVEARFGAKKS